MRRVTISIPWPSTKRLKVGGVALAASAACILLGASSCDGSDPIQQQSAADSAAATGRMVQSQPPVAGNYSPTRDTINAWVRNWESAPGKRAYTYIYVGGQPIGYYVLSGPPVSYAQGITMPYHIEAAGQGGVMMPNPGQDGSFANQGSGQFQWYGQDATTHRMLEWGGAQSSYFLSDKPLPIPAPPLGDTK